MNLSVCRQLSTSWQLRDHVGQVGLDWDIHVTQVLNLFGGRVVELEEEHDIGVVVEVWYSDLRSFWICRFKEDGPMSDRVGPRMEVVGHVNEGPTQIGFRDQQGWPQCLWKNNLYFSSRYYNYILEQHKLKYSWHCLLGSQIMLSIDWWD